MKLAKSPTLTWWCLSAAVACCQLLALISDAAADADAKCLTQKMLISCATKSPGVIACGGGGGGAQPTVATATEVLLNWNHEAPIPGLPYKKLVASLSLELSKPASDLSLVLLDLSGTGLCAARPSGLQLNVTFAAEPGPRLALMGLKLASVGVLTLQGSIVISADLLAGFPALKRLAAVKNNVSLGYDPLTAYSVAGSATLTNLIITGSIHSLAYGTPLLDRLASLQSARISQNNLVLLKHDSFARLPALRFLYLEDNNIRSLAPGALAGLGALEHLFLSHNGLRRLADYAFADLVSLTQLSLAKNRISEVQPNAFHGLAKLQRLDLSENLLAQLPETLFVQLYGLSTLNLQQNSDLQTNLANDTFCPLASLTTLWTNAPFDCERFGSPQFVQFVTGAGAAAGRRRKKYDCDITQLAPGERPCHNWLDRLEARLRHQLTQGRRRQQSELPAAAESPLREESSQLRVTLLIIFGVICLIHVLTTAVTIYACRRIRRARRAAELERRKSPSSASSPEVDDAERRSLQDASPGRGSNGAAGSAKDSASSSVLAKLHIATAGNGSAKKSGDKDCAGNRLNVRNKSYDFNEDENRA